MVILSKGYVPSKIAMNTTNHSTLVRFISVADTKIRISEKFIMVSIVIGS